MKRHLVLIILTLLFMGQAYTQDEIQHEEVRVVKSYNPMVDDAFKININPVITDTVFSRSPLTYEITPMKLNTDIEVAPIKAARMSGMPQKELYRFFLKSGFGNYTSPYFEVFYNSLRSRRGSYGIHYRHLSSFGKIKEYAYPGYSENGFDANGTLFTDNHIFSFRGDYQHNVVHCYGRPDSLKNDTVDKESIRQRFHTAGFSASMESSRWSKTDYGLGLRYDFINDRFKSTEHGIVLNGNVKDDVTWFNFSRTQLISFDGRISYHNTGMTQDTATVHVNQVIVVLNPAISARIKELDIRAGLKAAYESKGNGSVRFFPDIHLKIALMEQKFILSGGLDGNMERNSFLLLTDENPFVVSQPLMLNTITKLRVYGGLHSAIGPRVNLNVRVSHESVENLAMFVADTSLLFRNRFQVIYDDGTCLSLKAEVAYQAAEKLRITGMALYQDYNMNNEGYALHRPAFTGGLDVKYNLEDKILAWAGFTYMTGMRVKDFQDSIPVTVNLKDIIDINLGVEYRYSEKYSGFIRLNNLAASKYFRWQHYPAHRFNMMAGITVAL